MRFNLTSESKRGWRRQANCCLRISLTISIADREHIAPAHRKAVPTENIADYSARWFSAVVGERIGDYDYALIGGPKNIIGVRQAEVAIMRVVQLLRARALCQKC